MNKENIKERTQEDIREEYNEVCSLYHDACLLGRKQLPKNVTEDMLSNKERELEKEYESFLPKDKKLAIHLHSILCKANHTDCCEWYYEKMEGNPLEHDWNRYAHKEYLQKAREVLKVEDDVNHLMDIISALKA